MQVGCFESPIGCLEYVFDSEDRLTRLSFVAGSVERLRSAAALDLEAQLAAYFDRDLRRFNVPLAFGGTAFQQRVWGRLLEVPYGTTTSYLEIAKALGNPAAVRAVGAANGANPIAVIVPCHRVVGTSGTLTGYAGGLATKEWLLRHEGAVLL